VSAADTDTKFTALALIYGPPRFEWLWPTHPVIPLAFRMALEKFFEPEEVQRVGLRRMAHDYAEWYYEPNLVPARKMVKAILDEAHTSGNDT
jgi:hypothetical protein